MTAAKQRIFLGIFLSSVFFATLFFVEYISFEMYDAFHEIDRSALVAEAQRKEAIPAFNNTVAFQEIELPEPISDVHHIRYDALRDRILFAARHGSTGYGVWAYRDGKVSVLLEQEEEFFHGHLFVDSEGIIFYHVNAIPTRLYRSENGGLTWTSHLEKEYLFWHVADASDGIRYGTAWSPEDARLFRSTDQGREWDVWKTGQNFFPDDEEATLLPRTFYGVAVVKDLLFVATGADRRSTFMSADEGDTWQQIWSEGFTASYYDEEKEVMLFGAYQNHSWGLAYYPLNGRATAAEDTWVPEVVDWPGYVLSIDKWGEQYYATVQVQGNDAGEMRRYGILTSEDGLQWERFLEFSTEEKDTSLFLSSGGDEGLFFSHNGNLFRIASNQLTF